MGQEYKIQRVGAYGANFSGSALVDLDSKQIFDEAISQSTTTTNVSIYPDRTDLSSYFYGDAQFQSWNASATPGDLWAGDFAGLFADAIYAVGFTA